jgi:hypothetical protein
MYRINVINVCEYYYCRLHLDIGFQLMMIVSQCLSQLTTVLWQVLCWEVSSS